MELKKPRERLLRPRISFRPYEDLLSASENRPADSVLELGDVFSSVQTLGSCSESYSFGSYAQSDVSAKWPKQKLLIADSPAKSPRETIFAYIVEAILGNPLKMASLTEIYSYIEDTFPSYTTSRKQWQNNVRHVLSINGCFVKGPISSKHGHYWYVEADLVDAYSRGDYSDRRRTRRRSSYVAKSKKSNNNKDRKKTPMESLKSLQHICHGLSDIPSASRTVNELDQSRYDTIDLTSDCIHPQTDVARSAHTDSTANYLYVHSHENNSSWDARQCPISYGNGAAIANENGYEDRNHISPLYARMSSLLDAGIRSERPGNAIDEPSSAKSTDAEFSSVEPASYPNSELPLVVVPSFPFLPLHLCDSTWSQQNLDYCSMLMRDSDDVDRSASYGHDQLYAAELIDHVHHPHGSESYGDFLRW